MTTQSHTTGVHPMISASNVVITGGNFTQNIGGSRRKAPFDILWEAVAHTAFHDSGARFDPPKCHPNTRIAVLDKIMSWAQHCDSETRDKFIMWLTGAAGAGKSAIAQSFIEMCLDHGLVIASFFFGRSDGSRNNAGAFVATLSYQIIQAVPAARDEILANIDADPLILTKSLQYQFTHLVFRPLHNVFSADGAWPSGSYRVVVIDGLDECLNKEVRQQILRIISNTIRELNLPIRFLIASRPEHDINVTFNSQDMKDTYARLYLDDTYHPNDDIRRFIIDSLEEIRSNHPFKRSIPSSWPPTETIESLVQKASGQFIYAATVIRFIQSIRHKPHERLDIVMNLRPAQGDLPFAELDALYATILSSATDIDRVLYVLSIYSLSLFEGSLDVSAFMSLEEGELEILFCDLGAIVSLEWTTAWRYKDFQKLMVLHASLHDFLLDPARSRKYFIDINTLRPEHLANILHYVTLDCRIMHDQIKSILYFSTENFPLCQSSDHPMLMRRASSIPIVKLLESKSAMRDSDCPMSYFIFFILFPFFGRMARLDMQWEFIEKWHHQELTKIFISNMPFYHLHDNLTALLCILFHTGQESLIPCFRRDLYVDMGVAHEEKDTLQIQRVCLRITGTDEERYGQCLIKFIRDPDRSDRYTIGVDAYTKAALSYFRKLERRPCTAWTISNSNDFCRENCLSDNLLLDNGIWSFTIPAHPTCGHSKSAKYDSPSIPCYIYLGYLLFFLPRSAKSPALVQYCQRQTFLTAAMVTYIPTRTALLRQAMNDYLCRVGEPSIR